MTVWNFHVSSFNFFTFGIRFCSTTKPDSKYLKNKANRSLSEFFGLFHIFYAVCCVQFILTGFLQKLAFIILIHTLMCRWFQPLKIRTIINFLYIRGSSYWVEQQKSWPFNGRKVIKNREETFSAGALVTWQ